jgi:hypothetical protein
MNQVEQVQDKPPYVTFEYRPVEDRTKSLAEGRFVSKDVAFAKVTRPGSRDTLEVEAENWLKQLAEKANQGIAPSSWATGFRDMFEKWKRGEDVPVEGTPIKTWPVISPSVQLLVIRAGFRTVEELAGAGDAEIAQIGTGAVDTRNKARIWLEQANSTGKVVERLNALEVALKQSQETIAAQAEEIKALRVRTQTK